MTNPKERKPECIERLNRKESQAILKAGTSMMTVKMSHKNGHETLKCRYCCEADETQEHIIQKCRKNTKDEGTITHAEMIKENNIETNRAIARALIEINQKINENQYMGTTCLLSKLTTNVCCVCVFVCLCVCIYVRTYLRMYV